MCKCIAQVSLPVNTMKNKSPYVKWLNINEMQTGLSLGLWSLFKSKILCGQSAAAVWG